MGYEEHEDDGKEGMKEKASKLTWSRYTYYVMYQVWCMCGTLASQFT